LSKAFDIISYVNFITARHAYNALTLWSPVSSEFSAPCRPNLLF